MFSDGRFSNFQNCGVREFDYTVNGESVLEIGSSHPIPETDCEPERVWPIVPLDWLRGEPRVEISDGLVTLTAPDGSKIYLLKVGEAPGYLSGDYLASPITRGDAPDEVDERTWARLSFREGRILFSGDCSIGGGYTIDADGVLTFPNGADFCGRAPTPTVQLFWLRRGPTVEVSGDLITLTGNDDSKMYLRPRPPDDEATAAALVGEYFASPLTRSEPPKFQQGWATIGFSDGRFHTLAGDFCNSVSGSYRVTAGGLLEIVGGVWSTLVGCGNQSPVPVVPIDFLSSTPSIEVFEDVATLTADDGTKMYLFRMERGG